MARQIHKEIENSLCHNAKITITEHSIGPMLLLGNLPVSGSLSEIDAK